MVAKFEQGKTYRHGTAGEPLECLWAGTSDGRGAQPLPPFPSGWAVLWRSGDSSREDAEAYSRRFAHLAVALLEYHPDTRTITVHELDKPMSDYTRNTLVWLLLIGGGIAAWIVTCLWSTAAADAEDEIDRELREMCDVPPR